MSLTKILNSSSHTSYKLAYLFTFSFKSKNFTYKKKLKVNIFERFKPPTIV